MYRLLIVDDEYPVRAGLRTVVPWEQVGCQVVGEASNGRQALAVLEEAEVDLV
ncbi:MAG: response regulator [Bacillota bacterium]